MENMLKAKMNVSLEDKLLRECAKNDANDTKLRDILCENLNWSYVLQESIKQGICCLVYNNLSQFFKDKIPQDILNNLKGIYYTNTSRNIRIYEWLKIALSSFNNQNLKVIPLKGVYLAEKVYNNIGLRTMADIDLLVKKEDLSKFDSVLGNLGYKTTVHKDLLYPAIEKSYLNSIDYFGTKEKSPTLHIHWHIVNVSLPTYLYCKNIKMDRFWQCASPVKIIDTQTLQFSPHHLILYLAEHALKHSYNNLIHLSDIDATIKRYKDQINWDELIKEAGELGMERQLFYSLYFTNYFLDTNIADFVFSNIKPKKNAFFEKRFFYSILNNNHETKLCYFVYLNMVKGAINKLKFIFRTFFPPPCVLALYSNLNKSKISIKDYILFLKKQLSHSKKSIDSL